MAAIPFDRPGDDVLRHAEEILERLARRAVEEALARAEGAVVIDGTATEIPPHHAPLMPEGDPRGGRPRRIV